MKGPSQLGKQAGDGHHHRPQRLLRQDGSGAVHKGGSLPGAVHIQASESTGLCGADPDGAGEGADLTGAFGGRAARNALQRVRRGALGIGLDCPGAQGCAQGRPHSGGEG
ncbi:unnamed protein product, partial [Ectocarpus fasciculatus]